MNRMLRIGKKIGLILMGMALFLILSLWLRGIEIHLRNFLSLFAGLSAWMGLISIIIWLWKERGQGNQENRQE